MDMDVTAAELANPDDRKDWPEIYDIANNNRREIFALKPNRSNYMHYTSLEGFYAIIASGNLRFTSALSTNDPSEFSYGLSVVRIALGELQEEEVGRRRKIVENTTSELDLAEFSPFIFCTSEADESEEKVGELSQWRLYGANGLGIALLLYGSQPSSARHLSKALGHPRKIAYGRKEGADVVKGELRAFLDKVEERNFLNTESVADLAMFAANCVSWLPAVIKPEAYRHEREVRFIYDRNSSRNSTANRTMTFVDRGGIRRPSIDIPVSRLIESGADARQFTQLGAVVIGPSGDQLIIEDSVKNYLLHHHWRVRVEKSDLPYRAL